MAGPGSCRVLVLGRLVGHRAHGLLPLHGGQRDHGDEAQARRLVQPVVPDQLLPEGLGHRGLLPLAGCGSTRRSCFRRETSLSKSGPAFCRHPGVLFINYTFIL